MYPIITLQQSTRTAIQQSTVQGTYLFFSSFPRLGRLDNYAYFCALKT